MLHLPLDVPRGLVAKIYRNKDDSRLILYAYHFPGTARLDIPPTENYRPREKVSAEMFDQMFSHLLFLRTYDRTHGKGAGMRSRPTFAILPETTAAAGKRGGRSA